MPSCPRCQGATSLGADNPDRPFCSRRCRELDLLGWLDEDYVVPGDPVDVEGLGGGLGEDRPVGRHVED